MSKNFCISLFLAFFSGLLYAGSETSAKTGAGFFITDGGIIVTGADVVENAARVTVQIETVEYNAEVLAKSANTGLAILRIDYKNPRHFGIAKFNAANLKNRASVSVFSQNDVLASAVRVKDGAVSAKSGINANQTYFQFSAPIQSGNSGAPIFNNKFAVIGVVTEKTGDTAAQASSGTIPQNINFGVKSDYISPLLENISIGRGNVKTMDDAVKATVKILGYSERERLAGRRGIRGRLSVEGMSVRVTNNAGHTVHKIYLRLPGDSDWGFNRLGTGALKSGRTTFMLLSADRQLDARLIDAGRCDIRFVDEDNNTYTKMNVILSRDPPIELIPDDLDSHADSADYDLEQ